MTRRQKVDALLCRCQEAPAGGCSRDLIGLVAPGIGVRQRSGGKWVGMLSLPTPSNDKSLRRRSTFHG